MAKIGTCGPAFILMMMIKIDGKPLMDFRLAVNNISWDVLLTVASSLPLLSLLTSDITGIVPMIQSFFTPIMGFAKEPLVFTILICRHLAFATPAASVFAQIVFGNTEWILPKRFIKYTSLMLIPLSIVAAIFGIFYGNIIF